MMVLQVNYSLHTKHHRLKSAALQSYSFSMYGNILRDRMVWNYIIAQKWQYSHSVRGFVCNPLKKSMKIATIFLDYLSSFLLFYIALIFQTLSIPSEGFPFYV